MLHPLFQQIFNAHFPALKQDETKTCDKCGSTTQVQYIKKAHCVGYGEELCLSCRLGLN